jgi:mevalonate kinase
MPYKASAPGSLMLLGEYAVLYGKHALVTAINKRITVKLTPRRDREVTIRSSLLGEYKTDLSRLSIEKPFQYVLGVLTYYQAKLKFGCDIEIESEFSDQVGLGSSAAVTVATLANVLAWLKVKMTALDFVRQGKNIVQLVQGVGSGADIAASVYGGAVKFQSQPLTVEKFDVTFPLTVLYSGFKTPTKDAILQVKNRFAKHLSLFTSITNSIGQCAIEGASTLRCRDLQKLGEIMNIQQGMMEALGVSTIQLQQMVYELRSLSGILGAKISGSGLGDCVIGLSTLPQIYTAKSVNDGIKQIFVEMSLKGIEGEKI